MISPSNFRAISTANCLLWSAFKSFGRERTGPYIRFSCTGCAYNGNQRCFRRLRHLQSTVKLTKPQHASAVDRESRRKAKHKWAKGVMTGWHPSEKTLSLFSSCGSSDWGSEDRKHSDWISHLVVIQVLLQVTEAKVLCCGEIWRTLKSRNTSMPSLF